MNDEQWIADINQLEEELPKVHADFFRTMKPEDFYNAMKKIKRDIESLGVRELVVRLSEAVALGGDAHTAVMIPQTYTLPFEIYPFKEGVYITQTDEKNKRLYHGKLLAIEEMPIEEVIRNLERMIPHENHQFILSVLPNYLTSGDVLCGGGIIEGLLEIEITYANMWGKILKTKVEAIKYSDYKRISEKMKHPLFMNVPGKYYFSLLKENMLYINYRKCKDMESMSVFEFAENLKYQILTDPKIKKLVIDFRNNQGGNSALFLPFLKWISENYKGKLYVIAGRDTFSSGLLNLYYLKLKDQGIFLGEATGGKPNSFGEVKFFKLRNSGLIIRYSTRYYEIVEDDTLKSFIPEVLCEVSFRDYKKGKDLCLEWIEKN